MIVISSSRKRQLLRIRKASSMMFHGLMVFMILTSTVSAQVNVNSKSGNDDSSYYELVDNGDVTIEQTTTDSEPNTVIPPAIEDAVKEAEKNILSSNVVPVAIRNSVRGIGLPGLLSFTLLIPLILNLLPLIALLLSPQVLFFVLTGFFKQRKQLLGIIYDLEQSKGIPLAAVRIFQSNSNALVNQTVADLNGKYGIVLPIGDYRVEVEKEGYKKFIAEVRIIKQDQLYADAIGLIKQDSAKWQFKRLVSKFQDIIIGITPLLLVLGLLSALVAYQFNRDPLNLLLVVVYFVTLLVLIITKLRRRRGWSEVVDTVTGYKVSGAVVRIYDPKGATEVKLTDTNGKFASYLQPGKYQLVIQAIGYTFPSVTHRNNMDPSTHSLNLNIHDTGWLEDTFYVDKQATSATANIPSNGKFASNLA